MKKSAPLVVVAAALLMVVGFCIVYLFNSHTISDPRMKLYRGPDQQSYHGPGRSTWTSSETAAPDSVEGKLRAEGKTWVKVPGEIKAGSYVQDILEGRLNQPAGRGAIGKVIEVSAPDAPPPPAATIDFGRGYKPGINLSELSPVAVTDK